MDISEIILFLKSMFPVFPIIFVRLLLDRDRIDFTQIVENISRQSAVWGSIRYCNYPANHANHSVHNEVYSPVYKCIWTVSHSPANSLYIDIPESLLTNLYFSPFHPFYHVVSFQFLGTVSSLKFLTQTVQTVCTIPLAQV